jgi:uncharacterized membrane protein YkoI
MKTLILVLTLLAFPIVMLQAEPEATKGKITMEEAEQIALQQIPKGKVKWVQLSRKNERRVWEVGIVQPEGKGVAKIYVDEKSGEIVSSKEPAASAEGSKP